jgi:hypothetical protein
LLIQQRSATVEEQRLITWLLTHAAVAPEPRPFLEQVATLAVLGRCECGCPSVDFAAEGQSGGASIVADAHGLSPEGPAVGVILWARDGRLSGLEVYDYEGAHPYSLPRPESLSPAFPTDA